MSVILPERLQQGIQESLPVIPNNGNPNGANNMPAAQQSQQAAPDPYAWLQPSPFMEEVGSMLADYSDYVDRLVESTINPQSEQLFNPVVRNGNWHVQPLNDMQLPLNGRDMTVPMPDALEAAPQYAPILPGE